MDGTIELASLLELTETTAEQLAVIITGKLSKSRFFYFTKISSQTVFRFGFFYY